jgi:hypothetical protein
MWRGQHQASSSISEDKTKGEEVIGEKGQTIPLNCTHHIALIEECANDGAADDDVVVSLHKSQPPSLSNTQGGQSSLNPLLLEPIDIRFSFLFSLF